MAKSTIIKELANGTVDLKTALKRAKILVYDIGNEEISGWINSELAGYPDDAKLPSYRVTSGQLRGSYFKGSLASNAQWKNVALPLGDMPEDVRKDLLEIRFTDSVSSIQHLLASAEEKDEGIGKAVPADCFPAIAHFNHDPFMNITSARVEISSHTLKNVLDEVESRLLDMLLLLEREYGSLDELDIDPSQKTDEERRDFAEKMIVNIYDDHSIHLGDNSSLRNSEVSSS